MFGLPGASTEILAISLKFHQGSVGVPQTLPWNDVAEMPEACVTCVWDAFWLCITRLVYGLPGEKHTYAAALEFDQLFSLFCTRRANLLRNKPAA